MTKLQCPRLDSRSRRGWRALPGHWSLVIGHWALVPAFLQPAGAASDGRARLQVVSPNSRTVGRPNRQEAHSAVYCPTSTKNQRAERSVNGLGWPPLKELKEDI